MRSINNRQKKNIEAKKQFVNKIRKEQYIKQKKYIIESKKQKKQEDKDQNILNLINECLSEKDKSKLSINNRKYNNG